jgi:hypothetical protein
LLSLAKTGNIPSHGFSQSLSLNSSMKQMKLHHGMMVWFDVVETPGDISSDLLRSALEHLRINRAKVEL